VSARQSAGQPADHAWVEPLPIMPVAQTVRQLTPTPTENPSTAAGEVRAAPLPAPQIDPVPGGSSDALKDEAARTVPMCSRASTRTTRRTSTSTSRSVRCGITTHRVDFTSQNTYKGLVEFYLLFTSSTPATKPPDSASPVSRSSTSAGIRRQGLRPRLLARWLSTLFNLDGVPGDKFLANGKIQPFFNVESRRYTKDLGASVIAVLELNGDLSMIVNKVSIREAMTLPPRNADER